MKAVNRDSLARPLCWRVQSMLLLAAHPPRLAAGLREQPRRVVDMGAYDGQDAANLQKII